MCRRECLIPGEECEYKAQCQAAEKRAAAERAEVQAIARACKALQRQEAGMEWRSSAHITRYSA
jgi:hypothetical protein